MLLSTVLTLQPTEEAELPPTMGTALHACFLELVRRKDVSLAERLHTPGRDKPFTVSPLQGELRPRNGHLVLSPQQKYWLRFSSLERPLSECLLELERDLQGKKLTLLGRGFEVLSVVSRPEGHSWAGRETYEGLYRRWIAEADTPPRRLQMRFFSPTTFRSGRHNLPLPLPKLVFWALAEKWNRYAPVHLGEGVVGLIEEIVGLARCQIQTHVLDFVRYRQVGFVGECDFRIAPQKEEEEVWARVVHLLADFAFFAGVGYKTTMGMGQARRVDHSKVETKGR